MTRVTHFTREVLSMPTLVTNSSAWQWLYIQRSSATFCRFWWKTLHECSERNTECRAQSNQRLRRLYSLMIVIAGRTSVSLLDKSYTMYVTSLLTAVLCTLFALIFRAFLYCFDESFSLRELCKSTSRAQISIPYSLYFKAVNGAQIGSVLGEAAVY